MAAGSTYTPIATTTLSGVSGSYTFSSISGSYTDLVLIATVKAASTLDDFNFRVNGDTGSNYSQTGISGSGSAAGSYRRTSASAFIWDIDGFVTTTDGYNAIVNFQNYSNSTTYKTVIGRNNNAANGTSSIVGLWRNTAAITSITVFLGSSNMAAGSTFTLYGIASA